MYTLKSSEQCNTRFTARLERIHKINTPERIAAKHSSWSIIRITLSTPLITPMKLIKLLTACLVALLLLSSCATTPYTGRNQLITMSESEEHAAGLQAAQSILSEAKLETNTARANRVLTIGKRIAAVAERPDFEWEFHTIDENVLNAFCLPGGKVFVYTGMINLLGDDNNQLAAVIGHEIAHAIARHGAERSSQTTLTNLGLAAGSAVLAGTTKNSDAASLGMAGGSALMQLGVLLPYSRLHESEADHIGVILAAKAGYDPRAAVTLWQKMEEATGASSTPQFLSTHPVNTTRIKDLQKIMPEALRYYKK